MPPRVHRVLGEKQIEALTVAMVLAPGVYARNRMFDFLSSSGARRARTRAAIVRGVARQLARATGVSLETEARGDETLFVLRYAIAALRLSRVVELSATELAALRLVAERAGIPALPPGAADRTLVSRALARLLDGALGSEIDPGAVATRSRDRDPLSADVFRLAQDIVPRLE